MASVIISGDTSGSVTLSAPATAGSNTIVLPSGSGTLTLPTGTATLTANGLNSNIVASTVQASTSGANIDFTGIPSWAKRITVMFRGVSTTGSNNLQIQLGTGSTTYTTSGYVGLVYNNSGTDTRNNSSAFLITPGFGPSNVANGQIIISNISGNNWVSFGFLGYGPSSGYVDLSATLTAVRINTTGGTDTFDAGSINILYE